MSTTDQPAESPQKVDSIFERICFICDEALARWVAAGDDDTLAVCGPCRRSEPCRRCSDPRDDCVCPTGPDHLVWRRAASRR